MFRRLKNAIDSCFASPPWRSDSPARPRARAGDRRLVVRGADQNARTRSTHELYGDAERGACVKRPNSSRTWPRHRWPRRALLLIFDCRSLFIGRKRAFEGSSQAPRMIPGPPRHLRPAGVSGESAGVVRSNGHRRIRHVVQSTWPRDSTPTSTSGRGVISAAFTSNAMFFSPRASTCRAERQTHGTARSDRPVREQPGKTCSCGSAKGPGLAAPQS